MRIWLINHYALPLSEGGPSRHVNLAQALIRKGHDVVIIAANFNHYTLTPVKGVPSDTISHSEHDGVPFVWLPVSPYQGNGLSRLKNMWQFCRQLRMRHLKTLPKPDVIMGSSPQVFAAYSAYRLAKRLNVPFVFEMRDVWPDSIIDLGRVSHHNPLILLMRAAVKRLYRHANRIITVMPRVNDYLINRGVAEEKLSWVPNFVNLATIPTSAPPNQPQLQVVYAGSHGLANDLGCIVEAAKILSDQGRAKDIHITLLGEGAQRLPLAARAQSLGLTNIEFLGPVPKNEVYSYLQKADVFLMIIADAPVFQWGISLNKLFDYLALSRPIISNTQAHYHPEKDEPLFYNVPAQDPHALADAMLYFQAMAPEQRHAFAQNGRRYCEQYHDVETVSHQLEQLLLTACEHTA